MTLDEAYKKGQYDMRQRIIKQWFGWSTENIGGYWKANRPNRKPYGNVAVMIRRECKVLSFEGVK